MVSYEYIERIVIGRLRSLGIDLDQDERVKDRFVKTVYNNCALYAGEHFAEDNEILAFGFVNAFMDGYEFSRLSVNDVNSCDIL